MAGSGRAQTLLALIGKHGWTSGVELGLWQGATSRFLLENCPGLLMVGVDLFERTPGPQKNKTTGQADYSHKDMEGAERLCRQLAKEFPDRFDLVKSDTADAASLWRREFFDFVFIDADHTTQGVLRDFRAWESRVKRGGAILGHDADWGSVQAALIQLGRDYAIMDGNVWLTWVK